MMNRKLKWILLGAILSVIGYFVVVTIVDANLMGLATPSFANRLQKESYLTNGSARVDMQTGFKCSAFSSAYVLRRFGTDAQGDSIYEEMPYKMDDGYVYPRGILSLFASKGYSSEYHIGNLTALKNAIASGNPVIVMIKIRPDKDWLHYVPVVGYTTDSLYIAESLPELCNTAGTNYTRNISTEDFKRLWNTSAFKMPLYRNTFIVVKKP